MIPIAILAGGLGTRLRPITETIPKSLLEVAGEPFIAHQLRELARQGIQNVVICVGYLGEQIEEFVPQLINQTFPIMINTHKSMNIRILRAQPPPGRGEQLHAWRRGVCEMCPGAWLLLYGGFAS